MHKLWSEIDGEPWLDNPKRRRRRRKGGRMSRKSHGRRKGRMPAALARYWAEHGRGGKHMKRRRRKGSSRRARRRSFRRNPFVGRGTGIIRQATRGLQDAFWIVAGKAAARAIPTFIGINVTATTSLLMQGVIAVATGAVVGRFVGGDAARFITAGALSAPLETAIRKMGVPIISPALAGYPQTELGLYPAGQIGEVPENDLPKMIGDVEDGGVEMYH
jgi:hypothetical protein